MRRNRRCLARATMVTLSRPDLPSTPRTVPSTTPGLTAGGTAAAHERTIICAVSSNRSMSIPIAAAGTQAEIRKDRIPPADARNAEGDVTESIMLRDLLQTRSRIRDGDEPDAAWSGPTAAVARSKKYCFRMFGSRVPPGLARHDEKSAGGVDLALGGPDLCRIGRIEHHELRAAGLIFEGLGKHLRSEARSAHAEEQDVGNSCCLISSANLERAPIRSRWPSTIFSQSSHLDSSAPLHRRASPGPGAGARCRRAATLFKRVRHQFIDLGRKRDHLAIELFAEQRGALFRHRAQQPVKSIGETVATPSFHQLAGHCLDEDAGPRSSARHGLLGLIDVFLKAHPRLSMVAERIHGRRRNGVDCIGKQTSSSTYRTSLYFLFLVPVLAQSRRCTRAPFARRASQRAPAKSRL